MDLSRYEFSCQKALHQGLQYARSLGHQWLEVEHVALALLRADAVTLPERMGDRLKRHLESHLARIPRIYGSFRVEFGKRLDLALDAAEAGAKSSDQGLVDEVRLWEVLCRQSTIVQTFLAKLTQERAEEEARGQAFEPLSPDSLPSEGHPPGGSAKEHPRTPTAANSPSTPRRDKASDKSAAADGRGEGPAGNRTDTTRKVPEALAKGLRQFTIDLSAMAERGELDPVIGRDPEVRRVLEILGRKKKNNPLLIGDPGVGKSAIAEAIALRIRDGAVPESMRDKRVLSLDLGAMLAGAKYRGEFEERMKTLLGALEALQGKIILFIDEIHMLIGAGNHEGGADAANLLKPALARGELQCLGATTLDEYRRHIERDPALERRFQTLTVDEPDQATTLSILRGIKSRYEIHHGVQIDDDALRAAVELSVRYISGRRLPDKAIDLLDEAASRLRLEIESVPAVLDDLRSKISQLEIERKAVGHGPTPAQRTAMARLDASLEKVRGEQEQLEGIWRRHQELLAELKRAEQSRHETQGLYEDAKTQSDFDFAARLQYGEMPRLKRETDKIRADLAALQAKHAFLRQVVGPREIAEVVGRATGIPIGRLLERDVRKLADLESRLKSRVFGQDHAVRQLAKAVRRARVGIADPRRPSGVFLFLGPTGVGKTETAKALAMELFADESRLIRIDMSEFMEPHTTARLVGAPPGYVGYGEGGELTDAIRHQPYSVVLLDELEKAHPRVLDLLLQVFEDGRLTDGRGRTVDFRHTFIIMTSNFDLSPLGEDRERPGDERLRLFLASRLRPEFVNRIDEILVYGALGRRQLEHLAARFISELNGRLADRPFRVGLGPRLLTRLMNLGGARVGGGAFGGRALRRAFETLVVDAISERLLSSHGDLVTGAWTLDLDADDRPHWLPEHRQNFYLPAAKRA